MDNPTKTSEDLPKKVWKITEKLSRLMEDKRITDVAARAQIKPTQIRDYTAKGAPPRYDIAFRLARALEVSVDWLLDDSAGWPPVKSAEFLSDEELMTETAKRYREVMLWLLKAVDKAERIDWATVDVEKDGEELAKIAFPIAYCGDLPFFYHPDTTSFALHDRLPGSELPGRELTYSKVGERAFKISSNQNFIEVYQRLWPWWPKGGRAFGERQLWPSPGQREQIAEWLRKPSPMLPSDPSPPSPSPTKPKRPKKK